MEVNEGRKGNKVEREQYKEQVKATQMGPEGKGMEWGREKTQREGDGILSNRKIELRKRKRKQYYGKGLSCIIKGRENCTT